MNSEDLNIQEVKKELSPKVNLSFLFKIILTIFFISYIYSIFFGQSAIGILLDAKDRESKLLSEYDNIQNENQKLQKKHFELIQLTPQEDAF